MDEGSIVSVVESLFRFHSGRFHHLPVVDDLKSDLAVKGPFDAVIIDTIVGREMSILLFKRPHIHSPIAMRRYPALVNSDREELFATVMHTLIKTVVFLLRATPQSMMVRAIGRDPRLSHDWEFASSDILGHAIVRGLFSKQCTFCFSQGEFSLHCSDEEFEGWHFKPPVYYNNIFAIPDRRKR